MAGWKPGDRVEHPTFGSGTVLDCDDQHTTVHFDQQGRRKFASSMVVLTPSSRPDPHQRPVVRWPAPNRPVAAAPLEARGTQGDAPVTLEQLLDLARQNVSDEESLNRFVSSMRKSLPGPTHQHVGVLSGMRMQQFQNWLSENNATWQLTDAQLLAVLRVELPLATGELFTGDIQAGLRHVRSMRTASHREE